MENSTAIDVRDYCMNGDKACSTEDFVRAIFNDLDEYGQTLALCYHADSAGAEHYPYDKMIYKIANLAEEENVLIYKDLGEDEKEEIRETIVSQVMSLVSRIKKLAGIEECDFSNQSAYYDGGTVEALVKEGKITEEEAELAGLFLKGITSEEMESLKEYNFDIEDPADVLDGINNNIMEVRDDIAIIDEYKYKEGWIFRGEEPLNDKACIKAYEELQASPERMEQVDGYGMILEVLGMLRIGTNEGFDAWEFIRRVQRLYRILKLGVSGAMEQIADREEKFVAEAYVFFHYFQRRVGDVVDSEEEVMFTFDPNDPQGEARAEEMSKVLLANLPDGYFAN